MLHQGAMHYNSLQQEISSLKTTINAMAHGQIQFQMTGFGTFATREGAGLNSSSSFDNTNSNTTLALAPAPAPALQLDQELPPAYMLVDARTVSDVWREYKEGIAGGPAVEKLESDWGARWRPLPKQHTAWCRRKVILDEVIHLIQTGLIQAAAVAELEARRSSQTLPKLHASLLVVQKERQKRQLHSLQKVAK